VKLEGFKALNSAKMPLKTTPTISSAAKTRMLNVKVFVFMVLSCEKGNVPFLGIRLARVFKNGKETSAVQFTRSVITLPLTFAAGGKSLLGISL